MYLRERGAYAPMQWASGANFGFSGAVANKLYLPVDSAPDAPDVEAPLKNDSGRDMDWARIKRTSSYGNKTFHPTVDWILQHSASSG
jgi:maltose alpha-D-glucosyltransferase/alpha-amylase